MTDLRSLLLLFALGCGENLTHLDEPPPYQPGALPPLACVPDLDGKIEAAELQAAIGVQVSYRVSPPGSEREVDVVGEVDGAGRRVWDLGAAERDDQLARLAASELRGRWYAASFPAGEFVAPVDAGGAIEGVYRHDDEALWLLGVASSQMDPPEGRTLLVYAAPVPLYRFPLEPGARWTASGEVTGGTLRGLPFAGRDRYDVAVDATGQLLLPDLSFGQAHRVRTQVTIEPAVGAPVSRRQVSFLFECFGEVARVTSRQDEPAEDFTTATEVRRLGL